MLLHITIAAGAYCQLAKLRMPYFYVVACITDPAAKLAVRVTGQVVFTR